MTETPETRPSLLVRVKDPTDRQAWSQFVEVYRPVIHRLARRKGLQHADAEDLVQRVLVAVAGSIDRWEHDARRAKFRTWLHRVAHNLFERMPSSAMRVNGNEHLVELNVIRNVVQESDDQGGVDMFGSPLYRGVVIRWNHWIPVIAWVIAAQPEATFVWLLTFAELLALKGRPTAQADFTNLNPWVMSWKSIPTPMPQKTPWACLPPPSAATRTSAHAIPSG